MFFHGNNLNLKHYPTSYKLKTDSTLFKTIINKIKDDKYCTRTIRTRFHTKYVSDEHQQMK